MSVSQKIIDDRLWQIRFMRDSDKEEIIEWLFEKGNLKIMLKELSEQYMYEYEIDELEKKVENLEEEVASLEAELDNLIIKRENDKISIGELKIENNELKHTLLWSEMTYE